MKARELKPVIIQVIATGVMMAFPAHGLGQAELFDDRSARALKAIVERLPEVQERTKESTLKRYRTVFLNKDALSGNTFVLNVFDDRKFFVRIDRRIEESESELDPKTIWLGKVENDSSSDVILFVREQSISGRVSLGKELFLIKDLGDGAHLVEEIDREKFAKDKCY